MKHTFTLIVDTNGTRQAAEMAVLFAFSKRDPDGCSFDLIKAAPVIDGSHIAEQEINARVTITRPSCSDPRKDGNISFVVKDESSQREFLRLSMAPADFAHVLTGMAFLPATGTVRGLAVVGKTKESERRTAELPAEISHNREAAAEYLQANHQEPGWMLDTYLGSQESLFNMEGKYFARYSVFRYV